MKKSLTILLAVVFIYASAVYAGTQDIKKSRDQFYSMVQSTLGFSKADCNAVRNAGFGPQFSLVLLYITRESGKHASEIVKQREKELSAGQICEKYNISYEAVAGKLRADVIKYNIHFPPDTGKEMKKNTLMGTKNKGGK